MFKRSFVWLALAFHTGYFVMRYFNQHPKMNSLAHCKGWYFSGSAPHRDATGALQFITFRLADSLPQSVLRDLSVAAKLLPEQERGLYKRRNLEKWLDAGLGSCALAHPEMAKVMRDTLLYQDGQRYRLIAWCIMPNHVHALIDPAYSLPRIIQTWKSFTTRWMLLHNNSLSLGVPGRTLWMRDYWDRYVRDEQHLHRVLSYIHDNPVKAGLCATPTEWRWSSAYNSPP